MLLSVERTQVGIRYARVTEEFITQIKNLTRNCIFNKLKNYMWIKIELYFMSLSLLFFLLIIKSINIPIYDLP